MCCFCWNGTSLEMPKGVASVVGLKGMGKYRQMMRYEI